MRFLDQLTLQGKRVLMRVDYNVSLKNGVITDDTRIQASLPTIRHILEQGASLVLCSHLGRPKGKVVPELSLRPVARHLGNLLGQKVELAPDCIGDATLAMAKALKPGEILMLENLRFHKEEKNNDKDFSQTLARMGECYVNDAFGVAHREQASVVGVLEHIQDCCAGFLLKKEWEFLIQAVQSPKRPYVAVSGGAKVSGKLGILEALLQKVDCMIIGGAMANTFLKAQGFETGNSLVEDDLLEKAREIMAEARRKKISFYLPVDFLTGTAPDGQLASGVKPYQNIPANEMMLDTGPASHVLFSEAMSDARTVLWNGPMGAFENPVFARGSLNMAQSIAALKGLTIVGGGDTNAMLKESGLMDKFSFVSTGGGSFMEFMEGKKLPAFVALGAYK